ncbi:MAG: hypothetical protein ACR2MA_07225 [Egibacteraceae bacterium]
MERTVIARALLAGCALVVAACASGETGGETAATEPPSAAGAAQPERATGSPTGEQRFPEVVDATLEPAVDGAYDLEVTISSPYDSQERYADGWRVLDQQGDVLGTHELLHPHQNEQPFTRSQTGLGLPAGTEQIVVEGRDSVNGYGGATVTVAVPDN